MFCMRIVVFTSLCLQLSSVAFSLCVCWRAALQFRAECRQRRQGKGTASPWTAMFLGSCARAGVYSAESREVFFFYDRMRPECILLWDIRTCTLAQLRHVLILPHACINEPSLVFFSSAELFSFFRAFSAFSSHLWLILILES